MQEHHPNCDDNGWDHPGPCVIEPLRTFTVTITGTFEAVNADSALAEFIDWINMRGCIEQGAVVTEVQS